MRGYWGDRSLSDQVLGEISCQTGSLQDRRPCLPGRARAVLVPGRLDDVIKRNGIRISLGEMARAFRGTMAFRVRFAHLWTKMVPLGSWPSSKRARQSTAASLIEAARAQLPSPMLPDEVFIVASLPMTPQGKVDRERLLGDIGRTGWQEGRAL